MRFLLVAEESIGIRALKMLHESTHTLVGVLTRGKISVGSEDSVRSVAESLGYRTHHAKLVKDPATAQLLVDERVDVLLNVYSMFQVCPEVIGAARIDAFNLHPGRLPHIAGRNPVSAAIYRGDSVHGVTLHQMTAEFDAGTIAFAETFPIEERDTAGTLSVKSARAGERLVAQLVEATTAGAEAVPRIPQDHSLRVYYPPEMPENGVLTWAAPARRVVDFVRAYDFLPFSSQWGHPATQSKAGRLGIARAKRTGRACTVAPGTVGARTGSAVDVATEDEWVSVERVHVDGAHQKAGDVLREGEVLGAPPRTSE